MSEETNVNIGTTSVNFDGVQEAGNTTQPGAIGVFTIKDTEYVESTDKGTPGLKCTFRENQDGSEFNHTFWITANALSRIQTLAKYALGKKLIGENTGDQLVTMFKDRVLPLKVTVQINEKNGKVYPNLPFGGFSAVDVKDLSFNAKEMSEIERSRSITETSKIANADTENNGAAKTPVAGSESSAQEF